MVRERTMTAVTAGDPPARKLRNRAAIRNSIVLLLLPYLCLGVLGMFAVGTAHAQGVNRHLKPLSVEDWRAFDKRYHHPERISTSVQAVLTVYDLMTWSMHWISSGYVFPTLAACERNLEYAYLAVNSKYSMRGIYLVPLDPEEFLAKNTKGGPKVFKAWCGTPKSSTSTIIPDPAVPWTDPEAVVEYAARHKLGKPAQDWGSMAAIVHPAGIAKK